MDEDEQQKAIRHVLDDMLYQGEIQNRHHASEGRVARIFTPLKKRELEYYLRNTRGQFKQGEAIEVVPPAKEARMAALSCKWNFDDGRADCWFYLGIWLISGQFVGFRFEPPELGNHDYYHSQPCRSMGLQAEPIPSALQVPERNPTWPLAATSSLELLLCLVVSIHGMDGLEKFEKRVLSDNAKRQSKQLRDALKKALTLSLRRSES